MFGPTVRLAFFLMSSTCESGTCLGEVEVDDLWVLTSNDEFYVG